MLVNICLNLLILLYASVFFNKLKTESVLAFETFAISFQFSDVIEICSCIIFENLSLLTSLGKLLVDKDSNGSESRPQTPNPILATSNVSWHNCRRLIYVPRSAQKGIFGF